MTALPTGDEGSDAFAIGARTALVLDADTSTAPVVQRAPGNRWRVFGDSSAQAALGFLAA